MSVSSSTETVAARVPRHVAVIMDGNGRWAEARGELRTAGHRAGVEPVRMCIRECARQGVEALTLFAFSSENWARPSAEVATLMGLFFEALEKEVAELDANQIRLRFIGERRQLSVRLQQRMLAAEQQLAAHRRLSVQVAVSYGGRWDILQAVRSLAAECQRGALRPDEIDETRFADALALTGLPDPDLFIRTGGEQRISNFLLWNLAYSELWFTPALWPDFAAAHLEQAFSHFASRQRRFGLTGAQAEARAHA